jgi:threonine synthase
MDAKVVKVRRDGAVGQGDPCNNLYHQAIRELKFAAFSCYAHDLWVSVEGAEVLGLEFLMQIAFEQISEEKLISGKFEPAKLENIIVQVGGGGLAHGVINALRTGVQLGILEKLPRVFLAQTKSCYPLAESYFDMLRLIMIESCIGSAAEHQLVTNNHPVELLSLHADKISKIAAIISANFESTPVQSALETIAAHRGDFFYPWNANEPHSVAEGILDDTTYDGFEIARAMFQTGGVPVILTEEQLTNAWDIGTRCTKLNISATGTAGLAALKSLAASKIIAAQQETAIIFTGVETRKAPSKIKTENVLEVSANNHPIQSITQYFKL